MDGMDGMHDHMDMGMGGMGMNMGMGAPSPMGFMRRRRHMMMHMTFFWGKSAEVLFDGWPGHNNTGMYALSLVAVFLLALIVEWLSHCHLIKASTNHIAAGLAQTLLHALRVGVSLLVMLAVMSFNGGVFLAAIAGHTVGFFLFGSRVFKKSPAASPHKTSDLPPMTC